MQEFKSEAPSMIKIIVVYTISIAIVIIAIGTSYRIAHPTSDVNFNLSKKQ